MHKPFGINHLATSLAETDINKISSHVMQELLKKRLVQPSIGPGSYNLQKATG
jgi:hypothetical protein